MARDTLRSKKVAPKSKGPRAEEKIRMPKALYKEFERLVAMHDSSKNDELVAAVANHVHGHDPATCQNVWCKARMTNK
jgi:hypothetical protein